MRNRQNKCLEESDDMYIDGELVQSMDADAVRAALDDSEVKRGFALAAALSAGTFVTARLVDFVFRTPLGRDEGSPTAYALSVMGGALVGSVTLAMAGRYEDLQGTLSAELADREAAEGDAAAKAAYIPILGEPIDPNYVWE